MEKRLPHFLAVEEVERLLRAPQGNSFQAIRDRSIMEILYSTGLRVSELTSLNVSDIDVTDASEGRAKCGEREDLEISPKEVLEMIEGMVSADLRCI